MLCICNALVLQYGVGETATIVENQKLRHSHPTYKLRTDILSDLNQRLTAVSYDNKTSAEVRAGGDTRDHNHQRLLSWLRTRCFVCVANIWQTVNHWSPNTWSLLFPPQLTHRTYTCNAANAMMLRLENTSLSMLLRNGA